MRLDNNSQPYQDWYSDRRNRPEISPSSVGLLIVFLSAFLFLAYMTVERPWAGAGGTPSSDAQTSADPALADPSGEQAPVGGEAQP